MTSIDRLLMTGLVLFPLLGAASALIAGLRGKGRLVAVFGGGGIVAAAGATLRALIHIHGSGPAFLVVGGWSPATGIGLMLDLPAAMILLVIFLAAIAIYLYAVGSGYATTVFVVVYGIALAGLAAVVLADDLFNLFVALEVVSLAAVILIAYQRSTRALYAAFRYLVISTVSIALYLVGVLVLYRETGELALSRISAVLSQTGGTELSRSGSEAMVAVALILVVTGLATRVALVPFHAWLPDAHGTAPHPVSALLSGLVLKAAFFALWRVVRTVPPGTGRLDIVLLTMGACSALLGVILALMQSDAKRLLAYHSISQMGLIVIGAGVVVGGSGGAGLAGSGALFHALSHAAFKSLLFLVVGVMVIRWNTHDLYRLRDFNRRVRPERIEQALFLIGAGAITGIPGLSGYVGKTLITAGIKDYSFLYLLVKVVSIGTVASFIKLGTVFFPRSLSRDGVTTQGNRILMRVGMSGLAAITLGLGLGGGVAMGVFSPGAFADTALIFAGGIVIYLAARTARGRVVAHRVDALRMGLDAALVCILAGTVVLAAVV